jgi:hypothetical protein
VTVDDTNAADPRSREQGAYERVSVGRRHIVTKQSHELTPFPYARQQRVEGPVADLAERHQHHHEGRREDANDGASATSPLVGFP